MKEPINSRLDAALQRLREDVVGQAAPQNVEHTLTAAFRAHHRSKTELRRWMWIPVTVAASFIIASGIRTSESSKPQAVPVAVAPTAIEAPVEPRTPEPLVAAVERKHRQTKRRTTRALQERQPLSNARHDLSAEEQPFVEIPYAPPFTTHDEGQIFRVNMAGSSARRLGLPVMLDRVQADLIVGADGVPRAIRVVSNQGRNITRRKAMKVLRSMGMVGMLVGCAVQAQESTQAPRESKELQRVEHDVIRFAPVKDGVAFERHTIAIGAGAPMEFVSAEASIAGKTVKGSPYSAEAITESTQTLADGNRIVSKTSAMTYRDSEGRNRREMTLPVAKGSDAPSFITINDPVTGVSYHLDSLAKIARKLPAAPEGISFAPAGAPAVRVMRAPAAGAASADVLRPVEGGATISIQQTTGPMGAIRLRANGEPKIESLGKRAIDGVEAEGSRTTMTIPAGEMGNERDIHVVTERWYSPELQTVILSTHNDPRMGETTYKLTNIKRGDPHPSLFQVPAEYTLANEEGGPGVRFFRKIERK